MVIKSNTPVYFALKYSTRSLWRNRRRTALTLLTVVFSVCFTIVGRELSRSMMTLWQIGAEETGVSHAQVHKTGYWQAPEGIQLATTFVEGNPVEKMLGDSRRVEAYTRRLKIEGIISPYYRPGKRSQVQVAKSLHFVGVGVQPQQEIQISPQLFSPKPDNFTRGRFVEAKSPRGVVIGAKMAEILGVEVGDKASLSAYSVKGTENVFDVEILGIVDVALAAMSKRIVYMPIELAQELVQVGPRYNEIALRFIDRDKSEAWVPLVRPSVENLGAEIRGWWQIDPIIKNVEKIMDTVITFISALLFLSACFALLNLIYVLVAERTVEIGTLMAIGARLADIKRIFMLEAAVIGFVGGIVGVILANSIILVLKIFGIAFKHPFASGDIVLFPDVNLVVSLGVGALAILLCVLSSIPPARRVATVEPVQAFKGQIS